MTPVSDLAPLLAPLLDALGTALEARIRVAVEDAVGDLSRGQASGDGAPAPLLVRGLDPHALYSRNTIAARWDVSTSTVKAIPAADLPPAAWKGSGVRYTGRDVLRYEGVGDDELGSPVPRNVLPMLSPRSTLPTRRPGRPPKAGHLPNPTK